MKILGSIFLCLLLAGCQRREMDRIKPTEAASPQPERSSLPPPLDIKDPFERGTALRMLAIRGPDVEGVIPTLILALDDKDPAIKGFAAIALVSFGEKARPALKEMTDELWEENEEKNEEAVKLTEGLGPSVSPNPIVAPEDRLAPVDLLVKYDPWLAGTIKRMGLFALKDDDPSIRVIGARALGHLEGGMPNPSSTIVEALKAACDDPHEQVSSAAEQALKMLRR